MEKTSRLHILCSTNAEHSGAHPGGGWVGGGGGGEVGGGGGGVGGGAEGTRAPPLGRSEKIYT